VSASLFERPSGGGTRLVSVVLPAFDEADNLVEVIPELLSVLDRLEVAAEVVVVDDGSRDETPKVLGQLHAGDPRVRGVRLRRHLGKSAALAAGIEDASGDVIVLMDADGQDDPSAIPALLSALDGGLDLVTGRRRVRRDSRTKRWASALYNAVTAAVTGVAGRDFNSGLKAMRKEVAHGLPLRGELHRYLPVLARMAGYDVGEVDVHHRPRRHGRSKFGIARVWRGPLDLLAVKFLDAYTARPLHLFGGLGLVVGAGGTGLLAWMLADKVGGHAIGHRPALLAGILCVVVAVQLVSLGLLGELVVQTRHARPPVAKRRVP
jgi:glycosyltransferase involved in cell wall biosynthesis